ncbi:MAG: hypothetical protein GTO14_04970 [Anaerolineales bacterium]|nr:hypothetical protein [Anaerolineales bacterium]
MRRQATILLPLLMLVLAILACAPPSTPSSGDLGPAATQTMQALATVVASTLESGAKGERPQAEEQQEEEVPPTSTPTATVTPTSTPSAVMVSVSVDTNCRFGPGDVYDYLGALMVGEEAEVVGKLSDESFWYIENPDAPPPYCWIWDFYAQVEGDKSSVPILTPPPTPTHTPVPIQFVASYQDMLQCGAYRLITRVENTGGVDLESGRIKVVVQPGNLTEVRTFDAFSTVSSCGGPQAAKISPGDVGYIGVSGFPSFSGLTFNVTVKLCTEDGLGGTCQSVSYSVTLL